MWFRLTYCLLIVCFKLNLCNQEAILSQNKESRRRGKKIDSLERIAGLTYLAKEASGTHFKVSKDL